MMLKHLLLGVTLFFFGIGAVGEAMSQSNTAKSNGASTSGLQFSFHPYAGVGYEDMPVAVLKFVVVAAPESMWVHEWRLQNRSAKNIVQIRRALFVYRESEPEKLLLRHSIWALGKISLAPGQVWPGGKCSGNYCPNAFAMLSASQLLKPLAKDGEPGGSYRIALGIDKVWFADGTIWEFGVKDN